ncbi:hypothetical protein AFLA_005666 [Aspergillus flavus NRRL3357]|nr:hypothetical protein AFLA_005666 [Aspergillus flavus NRRL3357]
MDHGVTEPAAQVQWFPTLGWSCTEVSNKHSSAEAPITNNNICVGSDDLNINNQLKPREHALLCRSQDMEKFERMIPGFGFCDFGEFPGVCVSRQTRHCWNLRIPKPFQEPLQSLHYKIVSLPLINCLFFSDLF